MAFYSLFSGSPIPAAFSLVTHHWSLLISIFYFPLSALSTPNCQNKKLNVSVFSSISLFTGLPPECPDFVSYNNKIGRCEVVSACNRAAIFRACSGATRVSPSPVTNNTAGYFTPVFTW
jgi:hypothetical protein